MYKLHILWLKNILKNTFKNYSECKVINTVTTELYWAQERDSYDVIIPRNIMAILATSTGLNSEPVEVTGTHKKKKKNNTTPYKGKEQVEKKTSCSNLSYFDAKE